MLSYLISSSIGVLLGALGALWFWRKATKLEGILSLEKHIAATLTNELKEKEQYQVQLIQQHLEEQSQMEAALAIHRENEEALRAALAKGGVEGSIALANSQYGYNPTTPRK
jgi:uncharacterized membrane protein